MPGKLIVYEPTPEEIAAACLAIQSTWSADERARRWCYAPQRWVVPGAEKFTAPANANEDRRRESGKRLKGWGRAVHSD